MTGCPCPSDDVLRRAIATPESGELDPVLQSYIDRCPDCQARMERLANDPGIIEPLRRAFADEQPTSSRLIETINHLSSRAAALGEIANPRYDDLDPWIDRSRDDGAEGFDGYLLLECIGRGGMGVVFKVQDTGNDRIVALKAMLPELARDSRSRERFLREARAIAAVRHPNVIAMYRVSEVNGLPYLVMEHVEGNSLEQRMRDGALLDPAEIKRIGAAVAEGLAACHEKDVIHRDIKPSNVLIRETDDAVKITDFGLAAIANTTTLTHNGYLSGTPDYIAPERLAIGSEADERSDLFSLGCLLYKMSTGEEPFGGDTPLITLHRIATDQPPPIRDKNPLIPADLEQTIASLMAKRPEHRPASAKQARDLLLNNPPTGGPRTGKRRRVAGIAIFGAVAALIVWAVWLPPPETPEPSTAPTPAEPGTNVASENGTGPVLEPGPDSNEKITVTTAAELQSAVETVPQGGRIEIDTDETLLVEPLYIDGKSVTLAAAQGREPTIQLIIPESGAAPEYLLRLYHGTLNLSGLRLQDRWDPQEHIRRAGGNEKVAAQYSLLSMIDADLNITGCRFITRSLGSCVKMDPGNSAKLIDTKVFAPNGTAITWHAIEGDGLVIDNSVVVGKVAVSTVLEGNADIKWDRSFLLAEQAVLELVTVHGRLIAWVSDCVIQSQQALVAASIDPPSLSQFKRTLAWNGLSNRIRGKKVYLNDEGYSPSWAQEIGSWAMGDEGTVYPEQLFSLAHPDLVARLIEGRSPQSFIVEEGAD